MKHLAHLSPADAHLLDAMLTHRLKLTPDTTTAETERARRLRGVMSLLDQYDVDAAPEDLVARTLTRIQEAKQRRRFAQQIQALGGRERIGFQWRELLTVAAVMMIAVSLLWPVLDRIRADARRVACANNLAIAGQAFGRYANDHNQALPRGRVRPGTVWWNVGAVPSDPDHHVGSNSAHLYILVRSRYIDAGTLQCPDNAGAVGHMSHSMHDWPTAKAVSYSYQNQYTQKAIRLDQLPDMAILADKNPLSVKRSDRDAGLAYQSDMDPASPSNFHGRRGQNILMPSGRVMWSTRPVGPNGDNIWLIRGVRTYEGVETPRESDDSFLVP